MKVIFLDRDDTVIVDRHYLSEPDGVTLLPGAAAGLRAFQSMGYSAVLLTNQSGIARGYFTRDALESIHRRLRSVLWSEGVRLAGIYVCPHGPEDGCSCRKPGRGLFEQACRDFPMDAAHAAMIGDSGVDMGLAHACGLRAIQVTNGRKAPLAEADDVCRDLLEASSLPFFRSQACFSACVP